MNENGKSMSTGKRINQDIILIFLLSFAVLSAYVLLHLRFMREDVDDAWTLSFFYNLLVRHIPPEATFGGGLASPHFFGMTQAYIYSFLLNITGWTKGNAHWISSFLMAAAAAMWYLIARKLNFQLYNAVLFALMILWCDPFFREANLARPESLTFFLVSLSFMLFLYKKPFLSGLSVMVAFENHPMGLFALIFIVAYLISNHDFLSHFSKNFLLLPALFIAGLACGTAYFLVLHFPYLDEIYKSIKIASNSRSYSVLEDYFFHFIARLHIFVFIFFLVCLVAFLIRKGWKDYPFIVYLLLLSILVNFINHRDNYHYTLYFYVSFLFLSFFCLEGTKWRRAAPIVLFFIVSLNYGYAMLHNRSFDFNKKIFLLKSYVPNDRLAVLGSPDEWFAFIGRDFYASTYTHSFDTNSINFYNIEDDSYRNNDNSSGGHREYKAYLKTHYTAKPVTNFTVNGENYDIFLLHKR